MRIHDPTKSIQFKKECAGNDKKVMKLSSAKDKLYFISANDRSIIIEYDLRSIDLKNREIKFKYGKIVDFELLDDRELASLNKEGWIQTRDLKRKEHVPHTHKLNLKHSAMEKSDGENNHKTPTSHKAHLKQEHAEDGSVIKEDILFQILNSKFLLLLRR